MQLKDLVIINRLQRHNKYLINLFSYRVTFNNPINFKLLTPHSQKILQEFTDQSNVKFCDFSVSYKSCINTLTSSLMSSSSHDFHCAVIIKDKATFDGRFEVKQNSIIIFLLTKLHRVSK